ncbi:putative 6-phosphogluconolactonase [Ceratocystis fimbriata CBS 114723]|uniref:Putative 6-phosphogluconolactonase n=1 Tax=Ceratocystis fimbriata CBS 114723 TaxID=1035309 RepID=A0A2C5WZI7_9PEZI|nr:putative 6-phosphogluconolactonase [Ceratocystis fimbriata CBS 114723]
MKYQIVSLLVNGAGAANLLAAHSSGSVFSLSFDKDTLTQTGVVSGDQAGPSWITLSSNNGGKKAYIADSSGENAVSATYDVDTNGQLKNAVLGKSPTGVVHSALYGNGFFAGARYDGGSVFTQRLPLDDNSPVLDSFVYTMSSPGPNADRQQSPHPHATFVDPTGQFLLVPDLGADLIRIFRIETSGKLTECPAAATQGGEGPRHGAFWKSTSSETTGLYVVNELGNSITHWSVNYGQCLELASVQTLSSYTAEKPGKAGTKAAEIQVKDNFVYVSNRGDESFGAQQDSIASYSIDPTTGEMKFMELTSAHGYMPRTFDIHPDGHLMAIAGQTSSNVAIVERDTATGKLGKLVANLEVGAVGDVNKGDGLNAVVWV